MENIYMFFIIIILPSSAYTGKVMESTTLHTVFLFSTLSWPKVYVHA